MLYVIILKSTIFQHYKMLTLFKISFSFKYEIHLTFTLFSGNILSDLFNIKVLFVYFNRTSGK